MMEISALTFLTTGVAVFAVAFGLFAFLASINRPLLLPICLLFLTGVWALSFYFFPTSDFVQTPLFTDYAIPLCLSLLVWLGGESRFSPRISTLITLGAVIAGCFFLPQGSEAVLPSLPPVLSFALIGLFWSVFSFAYPLFNKLPTLPAVQSAALTLSMALLTLLGGAPLILGLGCFNLFAVLCAFLIFNWPPARLELSDAQARGLGFLSAWLILLYATELSGTAVLIVALPFLYQVVMAVAKKLTRLPRFADISNNNVFAETVAEGLSLNDACAYFVRICLVLVIMSCLQLYAPNPYSLPLLCLAILIWNLSRLRHFQQPIASFKEQNRQLVTDFKTGLAKLKQDFNRYKDKDR